jgi:Flp pilus assembly protein CpaB
MRSRIFAVLAVAILAGGALAYGTYNMVNKQPQSAAGPTATQPVVVASANLQLGAELKEGDLTVVGFPKGKAPEGTFAQPSEILGRGLIVPVVKNEPILAAKLASKEAGHGLPPVIPEGMRAVSVRVDEVVGVAGYVLPGNRVDVLATANPSDKREDITTKVILSNVQVLTSGTRMEQDQENGAVGAPRARQHRRQDTARASQPARPGRPGNPRYQDRGTHGHRASAGRTGNDIIRPAARGPAGDAGHLGVRGGADRGNDPRRQARDRSNQVVSNHD